MIEGKSVLDVACGDGDDARLFRQRGAARVVGVDVSERMITAARRREREEQRSIGVE
ncbi:class I SAM-dependent methyltransferase [Sorangium sp. So ce260]|uniref:class I SAM-dependent methyltransferase n=1 Tax=Sorangium sp. So ce260 TaxID=3133291 RepID=UPI003F617B99